MSTETTTKTEVLPELDEELDFEIGCEAGNQSGDGPCGNVATWLAITPRCSHHPFICETHRSLAIAMARSHQKVVCDINNCGAAFCLCKVIWRHL